MFFNFMTHARIDRKSKHDCFLVLHPANDAILAQCDTETEAKQIVAYLNAMTLKCGPKEK